MSALFVEQLTTIDFAYLCPQRGLTGETWLVDVVLTGDLNDEGMVFDFGHVKKKIKAMIDGYADHALLVPAQHSTISLTDTAQTREVTLQLQDNQHIHCLAPQQAILPLPVDAITTENVCPLLEEFIFAQLPKNVTKISLTLYPEEINRAYFHYSHGLKKHDGDCQRIAHGHRSRLKIFLDDQRNETLEKQMVEQWKDIYLATHEDQKSEADEHLTFAYTANQGYFELTLPRAHCYLMETDTTIELIATHLAEKLGLQHPGQSVRVIANEGYCKGAIGVS